MADMTHDYDDDDDAAADDDDADDADGDDDDDAADDDCVDDDDDDGDDDGGGDGDNFGFEYVHYPQHSDVGLGGKRLRNRSWSMSFHWRCPERGGVYQGRIGVIDHNRSLSCDECCQQCKYDLVRRMR